MSDSHSRSSSAGQERAHPLLIIEGAEPRCLDVSQEVDDALDLFPSEGYGPAPGSRHPIGSSGERSIIEYVYVGLDEIAASSPTIKPHRHGRVRGLNRAGRRALGAIARLIAMMGRCRVAAVAASERGLRRATQLMARAIYIVAVLPVTAFRRVAAAVLAGIRTVSASALAAFRQVVASIRAVWGGVGFAARLVVVKVGKIFVRVDAAWRCVVAHLAAERVRAAAFAIAVYRGAAALIAVNTIRAGRSASRIAIPIRRIPAGTVAAGRAASRSVPTLVFASTAAMLTFVVIARPFDSFLEMRQRLTSPPVSLVSSAAVTPAIAHPTRLVPGLAFTSVAAFRSAIPYRSTIPEIAPTRAVLPTDALARRNDTRAIQTILNRYRDAVSVLDIRAVRTVWPSADVNALQATFAGRAEQNVEFDVCRISPQQENATASCAGVIEFGFSAGNRRRKVERTRWDFTLRKMARQWRITTVATRPG